MNDDDVAIIWSVRMSMSWRCSRTPYT